MKSDSEIKEDVKDKYSRIAKGEITIDAMTTPSSCCCGGSKNKAVLDMSSVYDLQDRSAIPEGADLGLGCGTPAAYAGMKEGMTVLDLGSGAGIDCFVASRYVGPSGKVIGIDMTGDMIQKANENKLKMHADNVEFRLGEIESLPVQDESVDRVISNCVINLVPSKEKAFGEIFRVLKSGGKFTVSDIVADGEITDEERRDASLWAGCISGAISRADYLGIIARTGFTDITISAEKKYDYTLSKGGGLYSVTITARKP